MRGWLMLEKFGLPYQTRMVGLYAGTMAAELAHIAPARTVPAMTTPEGFVLTDSLAMAETLVERHPDVALYPRDPAARALARSICAEMHSGFNALRGQCPNMIAHVWDGFTPSDAVRADLARIEELWALARARHGTDSPWLFGDYSLQTSSMPRWRCGSPPMACRSVRPHRPMSMPICAIRPFWTGAVRRWKKSTTRGRIQWTYLPATGPLTIRKPPQATR